MEEIDVNAIAADAAAQLVRDACTSALGGISDIVKSIRTRFFSDFESHTLSVYQSLTNVKIITSGDKPVPFSSVYTPSSFTCSDTSYQDSQIMDSIVAGKRCVLSGNGGAGKSFMMRHVWMEVVKRRSGKVPVLIELRRLNSLSSYDIMNFIRANFFGSLGLDEPNFKRFCESGIFVFLFDGFDEVAKEKREELEKQILSMSRSYPKCGFVISGRPDDRFSAWVEFHVFRADPFNYEQFKQLIEKVPFDKSAKKEFQKIATKDFFNKHRSFLSNPLLSLMMLLTFRDNAEIPTRISSFYENCFTTLYGRHDALKEAFSRPKSLDQLRFKRLLSAFSLLTYLEDKPSLNGDEFISSVERALNMTNVDAKTESICHDLLEAVNLIIKEGDTYSYIHRSFQEYFAACCVANVLVGDQSSILEKFARRPGDQTLRLTYELHPRLVEDQLITPTFKKLKSSGSLPRRPNKAKPFNAAFRAGLKFDIILKSFKSKYSGKIRYFVYAFGADWANGYDTLSRAVAIVPDNSKLNAGTLHRDLFNEVVINMINDVNSKSIKPEKEDLEPHESFRIEASFLEDSVSIEYDSSEDADAAEIQSQKEITKLFYNSISKHSEKLDKFLVDNNKVIHDICEKIALDRESHNNILMSAILQTSVDK